MLTILTILLCSSFALPVSTKYGSFYNEFLQDVLNIEELEKLIRDNSPDIDVAFTMFDASTKIPSGLKGGNFLDLGHFDECYNITYQDIYGKYCLGTLSLTGKTQKYFDMFKLSSTVRRPIVNIHPQPRLIGLGPDYAGLHWAICVPSTVAAADIPGLMTFTEEFCYSKATEPELSPGAIATITVLAVFAALAVACTVYDIFLFYTNQKPHHELFIAFSFITNGRKLFQSSNNPDQLLCLNGIRAISMMWVILGHEYSNAINAPLYNLFDLQDWQDNPANMFVNGATVSVDTFFLVGGLVTVYTFLKSMDKGVKFNLFLYYFHRFLRLTPALAIMTLIHLFLLHYMGNGPVWKSIDILLVQPCQRGWWSGLLYISNYVHEVCIPQGWYLSADMQLYIVSPLLLIPLYNWTKPTLGGLGFLAVLGCIVPFAVAYSERLTYMFSAVPGEAEKYSRDYYIQPYTRFGPYVIGMIVGYFIYKVKTLSLKIRISKIVVLLLWLILLTGLVACVYAGYSVTTGKLIDRWADSLFVAFNRPAWALALAGVIFLCVSGYGHPVDSFLSLPIFQFLTKVSYSMYLVHYAVINVRYASMKNTIKFSNVAIMHVFWADFMVTLGLSLLLCLMFESPIIVLEKCIFGRGAPKPVRKEMNREQPEA